MDDLFSMTAPWWVFVLRAGTVFLGVLVLMRASGKRAVGQLTPFDLVLLILIGNAVQNGLNGGDNSLTAAVILSVTLVALNYALAWVISRSPRMRQLVEGQEVILAHHGKVFHDVLRKELVSKADFHEAMRENNVESIEDIRVARLETNGKITFEQYGPPSPPADASSPPGH